MRCQIAAACLIFATVSGCDFDLLEGLDLSGPWSNDETPQFELYVAVQTTGDALDNGYQLTVAEVVSADSVVVLSEVRYGVRQSHQVFRYPAPDGAAVLDVLVTLSDVAFNCTVSGQNAVPTQLQARLSARVDFNVACVRPPLP